MREKSKEKEEGNPKAQRRRVAEEDEKDAVVAMPWHGHLAHDCHRRDARATWESVVPFALERTARSGPEKSRSTCFRIGVARRSPTVPPVIDALRRNLDKTI